MSRNRAILASVAFLTCLTIAGFYKVYRWAVDIHRDDLSPWTLQTLPALGVQLELPVTAAADLRTFPDGREAFWSLHYQHVWIDDDFRFIKFDLTRRSPKEVAEIAPDVNHLPKPNPDYIAWYTWMNSFEPAISSRDDQKGFRQYRRNIRLRGGDMVQMDVRYWYGAFTQQERSADDAAINRTLSSIAEIR